MGLEGGGSVEYGKDQFKREFCELVRSCSFVEEGADFWS